MTTNEFLKEIDALSQANCNIKLYPYPNKEKEKLYSRFVGRIFDDYTKELVTKGWLGDLYHCTNGVDLSNYYIVPTNNYFNKKKLAFEKFNLDWIRNQNNPNEIIGHFCAFMTNGKQLVGYLENLVDSKGDNFIAIAKGNPTINDVLVIASNIYTFYEEVIRQLKENASITLSQDVEYWKGIDPELGMFYQRGLIREYKMAHLFDNESVKFQEFSNNENIS